MNLNFSVFDLTFYAIRSYYFEGFKLPEFPKKGLLKLQQAVLSDIFRSSLYVGQTKTVNQILFRNCTTTVKVPSCISKVPSCAFYILFEPASFLEANCCCGKKLVVIGHAVLFSHSQVFVMD